jgi:hypothetical protein
MVTTSGQGARVARYRPTDFATQGRSNGSDTQISRLTGRNTGSFGKVALCKMPEREIHSEIHDLGKALPEQRKRELSQLSSERNLP